MNNFVSANSHKSNVLIKYLKCSLELGLRETRLSICLGLSQTTLVHSVLVVGVSGALRLRSADVVTGNHCVTNQELRR